MTSTPLLTKTLRDGRTVTITRERRGAPLVATASDGAVIVSGAIMAIKGALPYAIISADRKSGLGLTSAEHAALNAAIDKANEAASQAWHAALPEAERIRLEIDRLEAEARRVDRQTGDYVRVLAIRREADALRAKLNA